ncbi:MAG: type II secretion system F family protein [Magnetococcales bacterium]|nr:type II secretion system F family protein [Magnetococcales bacterium]
MRAFRFKGRAKDGKIITGEMPGNASGEVVEKLSNQGIIPLEVVASESDNPLGFLQGLMDRKPGLDDIILFARQMETLTRSGIPLVRAVGGVRDGVHNRLFQRVLTQVIEQIEGGRAFSAALGEHPKVFNNLFVNMVNMGEESGGLEEVFGQLYRYMEVDRETARRIKAAMRYPMIVMGAMVIALFIVSYFVIPTFFEFYENFDMELPWQTQVLIDVSEFTVQYWYFIAGGLVVGIVGFFHYIGTPEGERWWSEKKLRLPIVGSIMLRGTLARFARSYAMGSKAGVPVLQSLNSVSQAVDNAYVAEKTLEIKAGISEGETLMQSAYGTRLFPPLVLQMMAVGEETGQMDQMMMDVALFYEQELEYDVKALTTLIEPILTAMMAGMVLILAVGIFLPMWNLVQMAN